MRRPKALETKEPIPVKQVSSNQISPNTKPWTMCLKSVLCSMPNKCCKNIWMRPTQCPHNNLYSQMYNFGWRKYPNFSWSQNHHDHPRSNFSNNFQPPNYQQKFSNQVPHSSFQNPPAEKKLTDLEKSMETFIKSQASFVQNTGQLLSNHTQAISRLEV